MDNNFYVKKVISLNNQFEDRKVFHQKVGEVLQQAAADSQFWSDVFRRNLTDNGYLQRIWTMYEIPFFYVYENDDFILKAHLFVPLKDYAPHIIASAIHHHNNYLLTTFAAFGPGYETFLFEKKFQIDPLTKQSNLKIREHFTQKERPLHTVGAWEPHAVVNPVSLSATLNIWSPDKKRVTDNLRSNPILKAFKIPLRKIIYALGLDKKVGIAAENTYQFYIKNKKYYGILEDEYFAPTRAQKGSEVDNYSIQTVFRFMQQIGFNDFEFISSLKNNKEVPAYYHKWIDMFLNREDIPETFAKEQINVPGGRMTVADVFQANEQVLSDSLLSGDKF